MANTNAKKAIAKLSALDAKAITYQYQEKLIIRLFSNRSRWFNQNNFSAKDELINTFLTISTHVSVNDQNQNTEVYSIMHGARRLQTRSLKTKCRNFHAERFLADKYVQLNWTIYF